MDIYALLEERLIAEEPLLVSIEDIAADFIRDIIRVQPSGPYFLAGQCDGSIVALEIARQLQRRGQEIEVLMQFDTPPTGYYRIPAWHRRILLAFRRGELPQRVLRSIMLRIRKMLDSGKRTATHEYILNVIRNALLAYGNDKVFDGEIWSFGQTDFGQIIEGDVAKGWDQIGILRIYDVPDDHERIFVNPDAQAIIRHVLEDAQRRFPASQARIESNSQFGRSRRMNLQSAAVDRPVGSFRPTQSLVEVLFAGLTELLSTGGYFLR